VITIKTRTRKDGEHGEHGMKVKVETKTETKEGGWGVVYKLETEGPRIASQPGEYLK
jgi:hypothetical protein